MCTVRSPMTFCGTPFTSFARNAGSIGSKYVPSGITPVWWISGRPLSNTVISCGR
jgi:hypothetical protein